MSKARPILFSAPMIRALLDGRKSQTRRALKPQPPEDSGTLTAEVIAPTVVDRHGDEVAGADVFGCTTDDGDWCLRCPYGGPGDLLWVRETMLPWITASGLFSHVAAFKADGYELQSGEGWTSAIHMPRAASRLTLRITDVRVQRIRDITNEDAVAEGCAPATATEPRILFRDLFSSINGPEPWTRNDWVWCISFAAIQRNVDHVSEEIEGRA